MKEMLLFFGIADGYVVSVCWLWIPALLILLVSTANSSRGMSAKKNIAFYIAVFAGVFAGGLAGKFGGELAGVFAGTIVGAIAGVLAGGAAQAIATLIGYAYAEDTFVKLTAKVSTGALAGQFAGSVIGKAADMLPGTLSHNLGMAVAYERVEHYCIFLLVVMTLSFVIGKLVRPVSKMIRLTALVLTKLKQEMLEDDRDW